MRKSRIQIGLAVLLALFGILIMAYPSLSNQKNGRRSAKEIASYDRAVEGSDSEALSSMLEAAQSYNVRLLERENPYVLSDEELVQYDNLLNLSGDGLMGYVHIPSLELRIPFYHGTDEEVMKNAVGHVEWTSLPVGGEDTHTVLSGHRGLPSAKLFSNLDKVELGERFTITVLDRKLSYEVDQILVVLPEEVEELTIIPGGDYCTLLTCTPYGINTHRLLVRGHRVENAENDFEINTAQDNPMPKTLLIPAVAIPMLFLILLVLLIFYGRRGTKAGNK